MQLKFCCPECGDTRLEEIMDRAHVSTEIRGVSPDTGELWYGEVEVSDGVVLRYQCKGCGYHLATNGAPIDTEEELWNWLLDNVWASYRNATSDGRIIEVWASDHWSRSVWFFTPYPSPPPVNLNIVVTQREFFKLLEEKGYLEQ
jgi:hypothetical protein